MKITNFDVKAVDTIEDIKRFISQTVSQIVTIINGKLTFADNLDGKAVNVNFTGSGVDIAVVHSLGRLAVGYFIINASVPMSIYNGGISGTESIIFLRSNNTGSATILVF